LAMKKVWRN